jgi:hypothetical protein
MIYLNSKKKAVWEVFITILLVFVCALIPLRLSLNLDEHPIDPKTYRRDPWAFTSWEYFFYFCDLFFLADLIA